MNGNAMMMQISVPNELFNKYESDATFRIALTDFLLKAVPCSICDGEGWVTPQDHPIDGPQADQHCPLCAGEKWEAPF